MGQWKKEVAPWVEKVAHLFGEVVKGKYVPATPLTGSNHRECRKAVKVRKAKESIYRELPPLRRTPLSRDPPPTLLRPSVVARSARVPSIGGGTSGALGAGRASLVRTYPYVRGGVRQSHRGEGGE